MRSVEFYTRISSASWLDSLTYLGNYAMKLYTGEVTVGQSKKTVPYGSMQNALITVDDLLVRSPFCRPETDADGKTVYKSSFLKAKVRSLRFKLSSTAAPSNRAGRMCLLFVWFSEAESLNAAGELLTVQVAGGPDLTELFTTPGVTTKPVSSTIVSTYVPPANSWLRDYVVIGAASQQTGPAGAIPVARGLPIGRLFLGYQSLSSADASTSYQTEDTALLLEVSAKVDLAEFGDVTLKGDLHLGYDATKVAVLTPSGKREVSRSSIRLSEDGLFETLEAVDPNDCSDDFVMA